jgi:serine/threonine protein kinase
MPNDDAPTRGDDDDGGGNDGDDGSGRMSPASTLVPSTSAGSEGFAEGEKRGGGRKSRLALGWTKTLVGDLRASRRLSKRELEAYAEVLEGGRRQRSSLDGGSRSMASMASSSSSSAGSSEDNGRRASGFAGAGSLGCVLEADTLDEERMAMFDPDKVIQSLIFGWRFKLDDFHLVKVIGRGRYSVVYQALYRRMSMDVALKCYVKAKMKEHVYEQVAHEIAIHSSLNHPGVTTFYGSFVDPATGNYYLIYELAERGDVFNAMARSGGRFTEPRAVQSVLKPIISALNHIHSLNIVHRDIKPENLLLTSSGKAKVTDFGFSLHLDWYKPLGRLGTTDYMAPEVIACDKNRREEYTAEHRPGYGKPIDIWAVGALAYEMVVGFPPFQSTSREDAYKLISSGKFKTPSFVSQEASDFISKCLVVDPSARLNLVEMAEHPWIKNRGVSVQTSAPKSVLDLNLDDLRLSGEGIQRASSCTPLPSSRHAQSLSTHLASTMITQQELLGIHDDLEWQYDGASYDEQSTVEVQRSATMFAVDGDDTSAPSSNVARMATRSFSLSHKLRRMGSKFVRRFRQRD